ncbi:PP2C family protein-serine/threonine phosphatase [Desulfatibacillum aliphaticivorans]|uniref:PP2C family protein-serine/threonine phosphatase n=1 Tax=Desulfatibacillum aliphaticivorans TaxID=218208 RepID=UPI0003FEE69F|nr:protein phosphatase 2C domain-containing protein [Desulfatibacillum aliphaticivorans]
MESFALSDMGLKRNENQDRRLVKETPDGAVLLAIADGMGSSAGGGIAAQMIMDGLDAMPDHDLTAGGIMEKLVQQTDQAIFCKASEDACFEDMGATLTAVVVRGSSAQWVHVGDSRLVLFENGRLRYVTKDQNMAWFLYDEGEITAEEARRHPGLRLLDQCVGAGDCEPVTGALEFSPGALFMLTTDGVHDHITPKALTAILSGPESLEHKAQAILKHVRDDGSTDDATMVLAVI